MVFKETVVGPFGSARTSRTFKLIACITKPEVILRLFGVVFSLIVIGCIAAKRKANHWYSGYEYFAKRREMNRWNGYYDYSWPDILDVVACNFGIAIGVISVIGLLLFLAVDAVIDRVSNIQIRKFMVIADVVYSSIWGVMWLTCFIMLTDTWRRTDFKNFFNADAVHTSIAFSFLSLLIYIALTVLAAMKLRQGMDPVLSSYPTKTNDQKAFLPAYTANVYSMDAPFSPHPFGKVPVSEEKINKLDAEEIGTKETPTY